MGITTMHQPHYTHQSSFSLSLSLSHTHTQAPGAQHRDRCPFIHGVLKQTSPRRVTPWLVIAQSASLAGQFLPRVWFINVIKRARSDRSCCAVFKGHSRSYDVSYVRTYVTASNSHAERTLELPYLAPRHDQKAQITIIENRDMARQIRQPGVYLSRYDAATCCRHPGVRRKNQSKRHYHHSLLVPVRQSRFRHSSHNAANKPLPLVSATCI
ncbi:hypothetical protein F5B22DRAFT_579524 [Xylaria bambusicola]|uniref:uncharacterized protein n=1 Tax=Xylaria bambusicola TaxID=326684 RepID=UPI0020077D48|nr:uncharacterized protein F5B22DRAFT_579524 [Xylaria bambusicola]KAI0502985.1 hypothetical protein F5B22DRAFT_579524 [Xylaria bambusicola]